MVSLGYNGIKTVTLIVNSGKSIHQKTHNFFITYNPWRHLGNVIVNMQRESRHWFRITILSGISFDGIPLTNITDFIVDNFITKNVLNMTGSNNVTSVSQDNTAKITYTKRS